MKYACKIVVSYSGVVEATSEEEADEMFAALVNINFDNFANVEIIEEEVAPL